MEKKPKTVGVVVGKCGANASEICRSLAENGISTLVMQKEEKPVDVQTTTRHWSGKPGEDLFFNGWKLLF